MNKPLSWYDDIGMFGINRPINDIPEHNILGSCIHRTSFCDDTCYNLKLYKLYKGMKDKDVRDEKFWQSLPTTYDIHNNYWRKIMELKDKLNLIWKFSFLAVFTYAVISLTCCNVTVLQ